MQRFLLWMFCIIVLHSTTTGSSPIAQNSSHVSSIHGSLATWNGSTNSGGETNGSIVVRFKRAAPTTNLQQLLDHASIIARISNGIALQSGLMNGSIQIGDVVGELLNIGSVSDIVSFSSDPVSSLTQKLGELPAALDSSVKKMEDEARKWKELGIKSESLGDVSKIDQTKPYFDSLKSYENDFDFELFKKTHTLLGHLLAILKDIESSKVNENSSDRDVGFLFAQQFYPLRSYIDEALEKIEEVKNTAANLTVHKALVESSSTLAPLGKLINLIEVRISLQERSDPDKVKAAKENYQKIPEVSGLFNAADKDLLKLETLMKDRSHQIKTTHGFPNGVSDFENLEKDAHDQWIQSISNNSVSLERLSEGLKPLIGMKGLLTDLNRKLDPVIATDHNDLFSKLKQIQQAVSSAPKDPSALADVFAKLDDCATKGQTVESQYQKSLRVIGDVEKFGKVFGELDDAVQKINNDKNIKLIKGFVASIGFTDLDDPATSKKQIPAVMKKIRSSNILKDLKKLISDVQKGLSVDKQALHSSAEAIIQKEKVLIFHGIKAEVELHKCLHSLKEELAQLVKVIAITQKLRELDVSKVQEIQKVSTAVSSVVEDLKTVNSITANMKKAALPISKKLNEMPDSMKTSETISQAVISLRSANELKKLETQVAELKVVDKLVTGKIGKLKPAQKKKQAEDEWGKNADDVSSLEASIKSVDDVEKSLKLEDLKSFEAYGNQISTSLLKLTEVKINTKDKLKALDTVIPFTKDPKEVAELKKSKETLQKLDSLDLGFASHQSVFKQVPAAFQSLHNFLRGFSLVPSQSPSQGPANPQAVIYASDGSKKSEESNLGLILGLSGGGLLLLGGLCIAIFFFVKYFKNRVSKKKLIMWIRAQQFTNAVSAFRCHDAIMRSVVVSTEQFTQKMKAASNGYLPENKNRGKFCNPETALKHLKKDGKPMPIHANTVVSASGKVFIATQAPIDPKQKRIPKAHKTKDSTVEDFWHMCVHEGVKDIVMLCSIIEGGGARSAVYFPLKAGETMKWGRYELKTISCETSLKNVDVRQIEVKDTTRKFRKTVITHYNYTAWPDAACPRDGEYETSYLIMRQVEKSKKPTVVHCSAGIGRTMSFIGTHVIAENVKRDPKANMTDEILKLRDRRWYAVQTTRQCYWLQMAVCYKLKEDYKLKEVDEEFDNMHEMFTTVLKMDEKEPEVDADFLAMDQQIDDADAAGKKFVIDEDKYNEKDVGKKILF